MKKLCVFIICFGIMLVALSSTTNVPTGYIGIPVLFGKVKEGNLSPGFHFVNPLVSVIKYDLRTQKLDETGVIPSREMLSMKLETSVNFRIDPTKVGAIYSTLGTDYISKFLEPHVRSSIREITSGYQASQLFSADRNEIASKIMASLDDKVKARGIFIEDVMLKEVTPPPSLTRAIESKQTQQQEAEAMQFRLQRESLEAKRKEIEAKGIQRFQEIVKRGIDQNLLAWKGIEATEALARSQNTKIIIIGNEKSNGMPLIMPTS